MDFGNSFFKEMDLVAEVGSEIDKIEDNNNQIEDVENMVEYNNDFQYVSDTVLKLVRKMGFQTDVVKMALEGAHWLTQHTANRIMSSQHLFENSALWSSH